ncbi:MAG: alpha/beta hydrolase [Planctomycetota bacterium]|jgi:hypothetical protein|nr:alpha/beta hydrolase [Planctomycetota bacterium]
MISLASLGSLILVWTVPSQEPSLNLRETRKLVEEFFALDSLSESDSLRRMEIVSRLDSITLDSSSKKSRWRKDLLKAASKRAQLTKKAGEYWTWEEEQRGRFIIGGETKRPKALLISFHGGGLGSANARNSFNFHHKAAKELKWLAIFPQALEATEYGWTDSGTEEWVLNLMESALRTWDIPSQKVYFAGHSMGGYGSWVLGGHHADRLAAAAPSAGAPTPVYNYQEELIDIQSGVIPNLRNLPMVVFQSRDDPKVPPDVNQFAVQCVLEAQKKWGGYSDFTYWEVDGVGHGSPPGGPIAHLQKIKDFSRTSFPLEVMWQPALSWKRRWYWLYWYQPQLEQNLFVRADPKTNSIFVESKKKPQGLQIFLPPQLFSLKKELTVFFNKNKIWKGMAEPTLGSLLLSSTYGDSQMILDSRISPFGSTPDH